MGASCKFCYFNYLVSYLTFLIRLEYVNLIIFLLRVCSYDFVTSTFFVIHILFFAGTWAIQIYLVILFLNLDILNTCNICNNHISLAVTSLVNMPISVPVLFPFIFFCLHKIHIVFLFLCMWFKHASQSIHY